MTAGLYIVAGVLLVLQIALPIRWAFVPLLAAAYHTTQQPVLGEFTVVRLIILVGICRAMASGRVLWTRENPLDLVMAAWVLIALLSSVAHDSHYGNPLIFRCGLVLNAFGTYLYVRGYILNYKSMERLAIGFAIVLLPFSGMMLIEKATGKNSYSFIGAKLETSLVRGGKIRAKGPFGTPILAGTSGACVIPLFVAYWRKRKKILYAGTVGALIITVCSASSGPLATVLLGLGAIGLWNYRVHLKAIVWCSIIALVVLHFVKERPVWYLMALLDLVGGSTGWHRAKLIDSAVASLGDWWLLGTDYTRNWMPYGLPKWPNHCDLTNYYIHLGVIGGLPLMLCLVTLLLKAFKMLGSRIHIAREATDPREFTFWCVGAALFAHSITFLSISYFDQMFVLFYTLIGAIPGVVGFGQESEASDIEDSSLQDENLGSSEHSLSGQWDKGLGAFDQV